MVNGGFLTIIRLSYVVAIIYCVFRLQEGMALGSLLAIVQLVGQFATPFSSLSSISCLWGGCNATLPPQDGAIAYPHPGTESGVAIKLLRSST